jgi:pilus assembly protein FimV
MRTKRTHQRLPADLAKVEESNESDYKFFANVRSALPNAEEILDEIQQAEFWMDMQQPQRAIEILESNWGVEQPSSPLPWLYLFDLYRTVRNKEKYEELTVNFKRLFNGQVIPWDDGDALKLSRSLEEFPFLVKKIIQLWGTDESVPFLEGLLIDERDGRRRGFDLAAYREILFLTNIAYEIQAAKDFVEPSFKVPEWSMSK